MLSFRLFQSYRIMHRQVQVTQLENSNPQQNVPSLPRHDGKDIEMTTFRTFHTESDRDDYDQCKIATPITEGNTDRTLNQTIDRLEQPTDKNSLGYHSSASFPFHLNKALFDCHLNKGAPDSSHASMNGSQWQCKEESFGCNSALPDDRYNEVVPKCNNNECLCCHRSCDKNMSFVVEEQMCDDCACYTGLPEFQSNDYDKQEIFERQLKIMLDIY